MKNIHAFLLFLLCTYSCLAGDFDEECSVMTRECQLDNMRQIVQEEVQRNDIIYIFHYLHFTTVYIGILVYITSEPGHM